MRLSRRSFQVIRTCSKGKIMLVRPDQVDSLLADGSAVAEDTRSERHSSGITGSDSWLPAEWLPV